MTFDSFRSRSTEPEPSDSPGSPQGRLFFALARVMQSTLALTSANAALDFSEAARARRELEHGLSCAELLVDALPEGPEQADALRRFQDIRGAARSQLAIAPSPTLAAIAAAERGDGSLWQHEEQNWIADRLARGSSPCLSARNRARRDTLPATPHALRLALGGDEASTATALACRSSARMSQEPHEPLALTADMTRDQGET
jgi:hypothetical protein